MDPANPILPYPDDPQQYVVADDATQSPTHFSPPYIGKYPKLEKSKEGTAKQFRRPHMRHQSGRRWELG